MRPRPNAPLSARAGADHSTARSSTSGAMRMHRCYRLGLVRREHGARLALLIEARELSGSVGSFAVCGQLRANEADHVRARGRTGTDHLVAARLGAVVPQLEQALLARREIRRRCPQPLEVLLHVLARLRELLRAVALADRDALLARVVEHLQLV